MEQRHRETVQIVRAWQEAANRQDAAGVLALSAPEIVLLGPRGQAQGQDALRTWLARAGLSLVTRRLFAAGDEVVAEQRGTWRSPETGAVTSEADVATWFRVVDGRVQLLARYDTLAEALAAAGLASNDLFSDDAETGPEAS